MDGSRSIGNSPAVAQKHYLQVTDDHFEKALRNALQQPAVLPRTGSQTDYPQMKQPPVVQGVAGGCTSVRNPLAGVDGNRTGSLNHLVGNYRIAVSATWLNSAVLAPFAHQGRRLNHDHSRDQPHE